MDVREVELERTIGELRARMVPIEEDCWYAHFFRGDSLVVVFQDRVFAVTTVADSWSEVIAHGRRWGVPDEQLDFEPRTAAVARDWFALPEAG